MTEANQEVEYFKNRALAYGSIGEHRKALTDLNVAIDIHEQITEQTRDPQDHTLWSLRAIAKAELCMNEEALAEANVAVELGAEKDDLNRSLMEIRQKPQCTGR